jgi:hypothetical protein
VTTAAILLVYAVGVGTVGARILARASWPAQAPLLAILTYLAAAWSVVTAIALAGLTLAVHATALGGALSQLIGACVLRLRATYATPGGIAAAGAGLVLTVAIAVRTGCTPQNPSAGRGAFSCELWPLGLCSGRWSWRWPQPCSR